jgi:hypothetical protein
VGGRYKKPEVKSTLKELYQRLGYRKTAKAADLNLLFITKTTKLKDTNGEWVNCFEILGKR